MALKQKCFSETNEVQKAALVTPELFPSQGGGGFYLRLPKGFNALEKAFEEAFPAAERFGDKFYLRGKTAQTRLQAWALAQADTLAALAAERQQVANAALEAKLYEAALDAEMHPTLTTANVRVTIVGDVYQVSFAYHEGAVAEIRRVPGARFISHQRLWSVPASERVALRVAIGKMEPALALAATEKAAEVERRAAHHRELEARRFLSATSAHHRVGETLHIHGKTVTITDFGKRFRLDVDMADMTNMLGHEGAMVRYAYYRPASETEMATLDAVERAEKAAAERSREAARVLGEVKADFDAAAERPENLSGFPMGETLLVEGQVSRIYGGGEEWVATQDEELWRLRGNGGDGDAWDHNNLPGTIATRVRGNLAMRLTERLRAVAALRQARRAT